MRILLLALVLAMKFPGFCGEGFVSQSPLASAARTVNLYPEIPKTEHAKAQVVLYPTPGLMAFASAVESPGRGMFEQSGRCLAGIGNRFYEVLANGTLSLRGTVAVDANPATMTTNGDGGQQLAISSGDVLYIYDLVSHAFATGTTDVTMVVFLDGRFIGLDAASSTIRISNLLDGLVWDPTQITQRSDASDPWKALALSSSKELWLIGEQTGSIYYNSGASPFPLVPRQGLLITPGIAAPFSLKELNGAMVWLSHSKDGGGQVVRAAGYAAEPISTEAVDYAISRYSRIDDAVAFTYLEQGHHFYEINFPTANATLVYDDTTKWWHERGTYDGTTGLYSAWGPQYHAEAFGKHLVADRASGTIHHMSIDHFTDSGGAPLRRLRVAPGLVSEQRLVYYDEFRLYLETGLALVTGQGSDPHIALRLSNDGGKTFGPEWPRSAGRIGVFQQPVAWQQLGSSRDRVFAVSMSDPIPWRIVDASLTVRMGNR